MKLLFALIALSLSIEALATTPQAPISELRLNLSLLPQEASLSCEQRFFRRSYRTVETAQTLTRNQVLSYLNFLIDQGMPVSSTSLTRESQLAQEMIFDRFQISLRGATLYEEARRIFGSIDQAINRTQAGQNLRAQDNDVDHKTWTTEILVKLAQECYAAGIPFDRDYLMKYSAFVGLVLSRVYGYPVPGESIVYRTEKLGLELSDIVAQADLPSTHESITYPSYATIYYENPELLITVLKFLKEKGYELSKRALRNQNELVTNLIFNRFGLYINAAKINSLVYAHFEGWPAAKQEVGITYEGRSTQYPGRPDWTPDFYKSLLKTIHEGGFEVSFQNFSEPELYAPIQELLLENHEFDISAKSMRERASEFFGSIEGAALAAQVPYTSHNQQKLPARFTQWNSSELNQELNPILVVEILSFIDDLGYDPVEPFLSNQEDFLKIKSQVEEYFGRRVDGSELVQIAKRFFGNWFFKTTVAAGLEKGDFFTGSGDIPSEPLVQAVGLVLSHYPNITATKMKTELSTSINEILQRDLNLNVSGDSLWREMRRQGRELRDDNARRRGFGGIIDHIKHHRRELLRSTIEENPMTRPTRLNESVWIQITSKKSLDQILGFIHEELDIFPAYTYLIQPGISQKINSELEAQFGFKVSVLEILRASDRFYEGIEDYRKQNDLPYNRPAPEPSDSELLQFLDLVLTEYPEITAKGFRTTYSTEIGEKLIEAFGVRLAGVGLINKLIDRFEDLGTASRLAGHRMPWSRAFNPTTNDLFEALLVLRSEGYGEINRSLFLDSEQEDKIAKALEHHFGFEIPVYSLYSWLTRKFGPAGFQQGVFFISRFYNSEKSLTENIERLPNFRSLRLGKEELKHILQFIKAQNFDPVESLLADPTAFHPIKETIQSQLEVELEGFDLILEVKKHFPTFEDGLRDFNLIDRSAFGQDDSTELTHELKVIFGSVLQEYPDIHANDLQFTYSNAISKLLKEKFEINISGYSLWREVTRQAALHNPSRSWNDFSWAKSESLSYYNDYLNQNSRWKLDETPEKDVLDDFIEFLIEREFTINHTYFTHADHTPRLRELIKEKFMQDIPIAQVRRAINHYYGSISEVRARFNLVSREVHPMSRTELIEIGQKILDVYPELTGTGLRVTYSKEIGQIVENATGRYLSGETLANRIFNEFGGWGNLLKELKTVEEEP
jgi:hypothetical protein